MPAETTFDTTKTEAFAQKLLAAINTSAVVLMTSVGHRTGLFDALARLPGPATTHQIAAEARLNERYVREWLGTMVTGGVVEFDAEKRTFRLPPEHAALLTRAASPNNLAATTQWLAVLGSAEDDVVAAFEHGRGVSYSAYNRFHEVMAEESNQTVVAALTSHILPLVPGLAERLSAGIDVLDIGCGSGKAIIELARRFPASRFAGYDLSPEAIESAQAAATDAGVSNARFEARDLAMLAEPGRYDLITAFDVIHDQAAPEKVLANVRAALKPAGVFLMQDISGSSDLATDLAHPLGPFLYGISCMHCMSVSLGNGGPGLGAMWGKAKALAMLRDAGFTNVTVQELPHDMINFYYIARAV